MEFVNLSDITTVKQLAEYLQINHQSIKRAIKDGKLTAFKVGRDWRIEKKEVIKWIEKRREEK